MAKMEDPSGQKKKKKILQFSEQIGDRKGERSHFPSSLFMRTIAPLLV